MNPVIRPERPGSNPGAASLLPEFALLEGGRTEFNSLLTTEHPIASAESREKAEPEKEKGKEEAEILESPFAGLVWQPLPELMRGSGINSSFGGGFTHKAPAPQVAGLPSDASPSGAADGSQKQPGVHGSVAEKGAFTLAGFTSVPEESSQFSADPPLSLNIAEARQKLSGMAAAQQELMLSRSQKSNEIAAQTEQILPEARFFTLDVEFSTASLQPVPMRIPAEQEGQPGIPELPALAIQTELPPASGGVGQVLEPTPAGEIDFSLVDAINDHIQFLRAGGDDSLELSLTPDPETELFLRLQKVDGEIFVQVRMDRGNFAELEFQWPQLQQTLASQGIKLENLATSQFGNSSQGQQNPNETPPEGSLLQPTRGGERNSTKSPTTAPAGNALSSTRWQRWA